MEENLFERRGLIPFLTHFKSVSVQHCRKFPENSLPGSAKIIFFIRDYFNSFGAGCQTIV